MKNHLTFCTVLFLLLMQAGATAASESSAALPQVLTARQAVAYVLANNPDIGIAVQRLNGAQAAVTMGESSFYPRLTFSTRYSQTDNPMYSFGNILNQGNFNPTIDFNNPGTTDTLNFGLRLNYNFYNGGRDQADIDNLKAMESSAQKQLGAIRGELAFAAIRAFNLIIQAEGFVKAHQSNVEALNASLTVAQARFDEGVLLRTDVLNLEVQHYQSEENLIQARNTLAVSRKVFLNLMGLKDEPVNIIPETADEQNIPGTRAFESRFELLGAKAAVKAAEARVRKARGGYYPSVGGFAGYDYDYGSISDSDGDSWLAGIQLSYDIFDGKRTSAAVKAAHAALAEAKENLRKTELAIELELKRSELALNDAENRLQVSEKSVQLAGESARIYRERFREGEILTSDLIEVENRLTEALLRKTVAKSSRNIAIAGLRKALGLEQFNDKTGNHAPEE